MGEELWARAASILRDEPDSEPFAWDTCESIPMAVNRSRIPFRFAREVHEFDPVGLGWITASVAARGLATWEAFTERPLPRQIEYGDRLRRAAQSTVPRRVVSQIRDHLIAGAEVDWSRACRRLDSPFQDCSYADTQPALDAISHCALYLRARQPVFAAFCISDGNLAIPDFPAWLIEVAIPAAISRRFVE